MRNFIKESHLPGMGGWGNGYVLLDENHPFHGKDYDEINEHVDVHHGLTFSCLVTDDMVDHWPELTKEDIGKWCVGFDTLHLGDTMMKWPKQAVQDEADSLMSQF